MKPARGGGDLDWPTPAWWLPGGHAQTIWPAKFGRRYVGTAPRFRRERWFTPDADFVDAEWLLPDEAAQATRRGPRPLLVLFHGLEGNASSQYVQAFAHVAREQGWDFVMPYFRGCSDELNLAPRAYHSGDHEEIDWMLTQARAAHAGPLLAVGISLGGNALLRWTQVHGAGSPLGVQAVAAVCAPLDLAASGHAIGRGFSRQVYTRMFLASMRPKALRKLAQHPGLFDRERLLAARDLYAFDNLFTAPLHGFRDTDDYWRRASAKPHLGAVPLPALIVNPLDDPFVPAASLPTAKEVSRFVTLHQPARGGHVGFAGGSPPGHVLGMPRAVARWLSRHI